MWFPTRREFLGVCATALSTPAGAEQSVSPSLPRASAQVPFYVYASESIAPGVRSSPLVVGFLIAKRSDVHLRALAAIKSKTRYRRQIKYRSNDEYKVGCAREFVRYFAETPDLRFVARVVTPPSSLDMADPFRASQYPLLFKAAQLQTGGTLRLKHRQRSWGYGKSRQTGQSELQSRIAILKSGGLVRGTEVVSKNAKDGLMELSNLLTGTLFSTLAVRTGRQNQQYAPRRNSIKASIAERLRAVLQVRGLSDVRKGKWEVTIESSSRGALAEPLSGIEQRLYESERPKRQIIATDV